MKKKIIYLETNKFYYLLKGKNSNKYHFGISKKSENLYAISGIFVY